MPRNHRTKQISEHLIFVRTR